MYNNFCRDGIDYIVRYLKSIGRVESDFKYMTYSIQPGSLNSIAIVQFTTFPPNTEYRPYIVDMLDYVRYYRGLKINKLKSKII